MAETEGARVYMFYAGEDYTLRCDEDEWRRIADKYEAAASSAVGGWVDAPTTKGLITLWASPSIPILFRQVPRHGEGRQAVVL